MDATYTNTENLAVGDIVYVPSQDLEGQVRRILDHQVDVMLNYHLPIHKKTYIQTSFDRVRLVSRKDKAMPRKKAKDKPKVLRISISISGDGYMKRAAVMAEKDDLCFLKTFDHIEGQTDWNEQVKAASDGLTALEIAPPPDIKTSKDDVLGKEAEDKRETSQAESAADKKPIAMDTMPYAPDTDMPWEGYEWFYVDPSQPVLKSAQVEADAEFLAAKILKEEQEQQAIAALKVEAKPERGVLLLENPQEKPTQQTLF